MRKNSISCMASGMCVTASSSNGSKEAPSDSSFPGTLAVGPLLGGLGNFDHNVLFDPNGRLEASSLRLYSAQAGTWSIWWILTRSPKIEYPVTGTFSGNKGSFYGEEPFEDRLVPVRTTYEPLSQHHAQWTQAYSPDKGATWEVNWIMDFTRSEK